MYKMLHGAFTKHKYTYIYSSIDILSLSLSLSEYMCLSIHHSDHVSCCVVLSRRINILSSCVVM